MSICKSDIDQRYNHIFVCREILLGGLGIKVAL